MTEDGKRLHFAEVAKQSKNGIQGNDKSSHTYSYSLFKCKNQHFYLTIYKDYVCIYNKKAMCLQIE